MRITPFSLPGNGLDENRNISPSFRTIPYTCHWRVARWRAAFHLAIPVTSKHSRSQTRRDLTCLGADDFWRKIALSTPVSTEASIHPAHSLAPSGQIDRPARSPLGQRFDAATLLAKVVANGPCLVALRTSPRLAAADTGFRAAFIAALNTLSTVGRSAALTPSAGHFSHSIGTKGSPPAGYWS